MSEIQLVHLTFGTDSAERNHFHEVALREARATTDFRERAPMAPAPASVLGRLRLAFAGGPSTTEACTCPA